MKKQLAFILVFLILLGGRLLLSGTGYLDDPDEYVYHFLLCYYEGISNFDPFFWCKANFHNNFFPLEVLIRLLQSKLALYYAAYLELPPDHVRVMIVPGLFNILVSLGNIFLVYKILIKLGFDKNLALLGILVYGTFLSTNIYTRHILPYENSYFFVLLCIYFLIQEHFTFKQLFLSGFFFACAYAAYFGFFLTYFVGIGYIVFSQPLKNWTNTLKQITYFTIPVVIYVLTFDLISRIYFDQSYILYTLNFTSTIYQGSYSEGLVYAFLYMFKVEKIWGLVFLLSALAGIYIIIRNEGQSALKKLILIYLLIYLLFGLNAVILEGMVVYGRVFRMYYLPLLLGFLYLLKQLDEKKRIYAYFLIPIAAIANYGFIIQDLNSLAYPRCEIQKNGMISDSQKNIDISYLGSLKCALTYKAGEQFTGINESSLKPGTYVFQNACFFHNDGDLSQVYKPLPPTDGEIIFQKKHFMSHPAYTFEYCSKEGRKQLLQTPLYMILIKKE